MPTTNEISAFLRAQNRLNFFQVNIALIVNDFYAWHTVSGIPMSNCRTMLFFSNITTVSYVTVQVNVSIQTLIMIELHH